MVEVNEIKKNNGNGNSILKEYLKQKETIQMNKLDNVMVRLLKAVAETNPEIKAKFREIVKEENAMDIFE